MNYAVSCQYAHHDYSESVELGTMGSVDVLRAFDEFDWKGQAAEANRLQKCSPTFSVSSPAERRLIWVAVCGDENDFSFVSDCTFPGMTKFLGLIERKGIVSLDTQSFRTNDARRAIELFMSGAEKELRELYANAR